MAPAKWRVCRWSTVQRNSTATKLWRADLSRSGLENSEAINSTARYYAKAGCQFVRRAVTCLAPIPSVDNENKQ